GTRWPGHGPQSSGPRLNDVSAGSSAELPDRMSLMDVRLQAQEDEITLLKSSLADALRKLHVLDQQIPLIKQHLIAGMEPVLLPDVLVNALLEGSALMEETGSKPQCQGSEVEEREEDEGVQKEKENLWSSSVVEEHIHPTTIRSLQQSHQDLNGLTDELPGSSSQTRGSDSPGPPREQGPSPLFPIHEEEKLPLCVLHQITALSNGLFPPHGTKSTHCFGQSIKMFIRGRPITMYIPSNILNYEDLKMDLPPEKLDLDWVYGYRGRDCRANLYVLPSGEAVYFIACVVVLYHITNRTQRHYRKHTDCVRCLAIHPDKVRVATGQTAGVDKDGKPFVYIWDSTTLATLHQIGLGTFERGVGSVAFSQADGGAFLCVIDDSNEHMLSVWDWAKQSRQVEVKSTNEAVLAVEFNPSDSNIIISCGKSHVYFWTLSAGTVTKKQGIFGKYKKPKFILCFVFSLTGDVLTGDSEGNILTWGKSAADTKTLGKAAKGAHQAWFHYVHISNVAKRRQHVSGHGGPLLTFRIPEQFGAVRTIGNVDGEELLVGTTRNAILRGTFSDGFVAIVQGHVDEMWGLATHPFQNIFLTCGNDRQVCLWNSEEHSMDWSTTLEESGLCADFCPNGAVVSVGLNTGRWVVMDLQTRQIVSDLTDGNEQLSVMRYSPDGSFLAVGSHDNFIYIYSVTESGRRYTRFGKCTGHSSFITHLDWSKDGKYIMSNSGDYEILYWDVAGGCKLLRNRYESKDREWASYTCVLGFHVMGVWLEGSDGTDINALCRSHDEKLVAVADDFCKVHLFQYPCPKPKAPSHRYEGHGSHVTNVCFTHSDSHLLSMGGKDTCVLQWRVRGGGGARDGRASASSTSTSSPEPST
uniref:HELP domain-containing protein n=1 Tax=Denticeps clupeoides TaxID=299321 RepID=A0AAY4AF69_9TELE